MLGEILVLVVVAGVAVIAALLKSLEVRAATETEPEPEDRERDVSS